MDDHPVFGLRHYDCNGGTWQKWIVSYHGLIGGQFWVVTIKSLGTGECLDYHPDFGLRTHTCNGGTWQEWIQEPEDDIWAAYMNRGTWQNFARPICLDDSGPYGLRATGCNRMDFQHWSHW